MHMKKDHRRLRARTVSRQRRTSTGLALGIALTFLGGSMTPALAVGDETSAPETGGTISTERTPEDTTPTGSGDVEMEWETTPSESEQPATADDSDPTEPAADGKGDSGNEADIDAPEQKSDLASEPAQVSPLSIPTPTANTAVITIKVGGDRAANGTVKPLAGVRLALHGAGTATGGGGGDLAGQVPVQGNAGTRYNASWSWTSCTSDADGDCSFVIPIRTGNISSTGVPQDSRFWVVQETSTNGWYSNPNIRLGGFGASPERTWQYRFRTDTLLRAGNTYSSTTPLYWTTNTASNGTACGLGWADPCYSSWLGTAADPDRGFMRNRIDANNEHAYASNVGRTTGVWSQSRNNPDMIGGCPVDIALIADTSGSLGAAGIAELKNTMSAFVDAFRGTNARMAAFSFSNISPGGGASNHPTLMPVTTAAQAAAFKVQYQNWSSGGGTNWDAGFATVANAAPHYDLAILLTDGNPTVIRNNSGSGSSAYNSFQDVDAGIFSANQLKAEGTRVLGLGVGPALTAASDNNLRAVSGPAKNSDYFRTSSFDEATQVLVNLAKERCTGSIGVQKLIVPEGGTVADATPAPAGWEFGAATPNGGATMTPSSQTTVAGGEGKVEFGLSYTPGSTSADVQIHEVQQEGFKLVPVNGKNADCTNKNTGAPVSVTNSGDAAKPAFGLTAPQNQRIECKIYNQPVSPGEIAVEKSSDPASGAEVSPGQEVSYTLTFTNTGGQPAAVAYDDVMTDVLDDASLVSGPTAQAPLTAVYDGVSKRIKVTGTLAAGDTKTVTYAVKVKDPLPADADGVLGNFVVKTGENPPTECEPDDPLCTEHPVTGTLSWNKVDSSDTLNLLAGSKWTLTPYDADDKLIHSKMVTVEDCVADDVADCVGADRDPAEGKFLLTGLVPGKFSLAEVEAPAGYQLLEQPIDVVINTNYVLGDIENDQAEAPQLPLTGGMGTLAIFLGAGGIGVLLLIALTLQRRRSKVSIG